MFTLNNISGVIVTNAVGGQCTVVVTPDVQTSANIVDKIYLYELQVTLQDGTVTSQCVGDLQVMATLFGPRIKKENYAYSRIFETRIDL